MHDGVDFYSYLRHPAYTSNHPRFESASRDVMGRFDPMSAVLFLDESVSRALDTRGTLPLSSVEEPGSPTLLPFSTYLHEIIHWWQHIGSTSGLVYGLSIPVQATATAKYLSECLDQVPKPLIVQAPGSLPHDHPATLAALRWAEIEHGATLVFDPETASFTLGNCPWLYESLGHATLLMHVSTVASLAGVLDHGGSALGDPAAWLDLYDRFVAEARPCFTPGEIVELPIGMRQLAEGQARISELQYRSLTHQPMTWAEAKGRSLLDGVYGAAMDVFLRLSGLPEPEGPCDPGVNLFLLLCDIALNPSEGYPDEPGHNGEFVYRVHPGIRFMRLCRLTAGDDELLRRLRVLSLDSYTFAAHRLCERAGWPTPVQVAQRVLARLSNTAGAEGLARQRERGDYGTVDVPIRLYMAEHLAFLESKSTMPHLVCWPAHFLTGGPGMLDDAELRASEAAIGWHLPPFVASTLDGGVDAANLPDVPADRRSKLASDFFATQVLYDMARQWISRWGGFSLAYPWKPRLSDDERERLHEQFAASFGMHPDRVVAPLAP